MPMFNRTLKTQELTQLGMMIAVLEVSKLALNHLPNIELVSFWVILFTLTFGLRSIYAIYGFVLIEGILYGIHFWWVAYLYIWIILALITWSFRQQQSALFWSITSAIFGLFFGAMCSIPYFITGALSGGLYNGLIAGFSWWIAGIPFDFLHCAGNFFTMLILYKPIRKVMQRL